MTNHDDQKVYIFSCAKETGELIESISKHVDGGTDAVFQKGILLVGLMAQAYKQGNKIAILDKDDKIIDYITGI